MTQPTQTLYHPGERVQQRGYYFLVDSHGNKKPYTVFLAPEEVFPDTPDTKQGFCYQLNPGKHLTSVGGMPISE